MMKWILFFFCMPAFAVRVTVNCATTPLAITYSAVAPSANSQFQNMQSMSHFKIINPTGSRICMDTGQYTITTPAVNGPNEYCVPGSDTESWDNVTVNNNAYLRADVSYCTTGSFDVDIW